MFPKRFGAAAFALSFFMSVNAPAIVFASDSGSMTTPTVTTPAPATTPASTTKEAKKAAALACVASAIDKREGSVDAGFMAYSTAVSAAYTARKSALAAAFAMTDDKARKDARKAAWSTFNDALKAAKKDWKAAKKSAWDTDKSDRKACGKDAPSGDNGSKDSEA